MRTYMNHSSETVETRAREEVESSRDRRVVDDVPSRGLLEMQPSLFVEIDRSGKQRIFVVLCRRRRSRRRLLRTSSTSRRRDVSQQTSPQIGRSSSSIHTVPLSGRRSSVRMISRLDRLSIARILRIRLYLLLRLLLDDVSIDFELLVELRQIRLHFRVRNSHQQRDEGSDKRFDSYSLGSREAALISVEVGEGELEDVEQHIAIGES